MATEEKKPASNESTRMEGDVPQPPAPLTRSATLFSPRVKMGVVLLLIVAGLSYFAWSAFGSATVTYAKVSEIATAGPTAPDRTVGVIGKLVKDSYVRSADGVTANFKLVDDGGIQQMQVQYQGEIGQVFFNDHSQIILSGRMNADNVFHASELQVKCPSKYLTEEEKAELEQKNSGDAVPPPYQPDYFQNNT